MHVRIAAVTLLLWGWSAAAQVRETVEVSRTNVDVVVTDGRGRPVRGLTRDEFEILEGGRRREITNFSEVTVKGPAEGPAVLAPPRSVLIVFDNSSLTMNNRRTAADAAKDFVANLRPIDRVAVMTALPSLQPRQSWTIDKSAAAVAIDGVAREATSTTEAQRHVVEGQIMDVVRRARNPSQLDQISFDEASRAARVYASSALRDGRVLASAIDRSLTTFSRSGHKKVLLLVGEGIPVNPGSDVWSYLNSIKMDVESGTGSAPFGATARTASPMAESTQYDLSPEIRALNVHALKSGIVVYAMNPGQNESTSGKVLDDQPSDTRMEFARTAGNMSGYELLVRNTGGSAFFGMPPRMALERITSDLDSYYSIGYRSEPLPTGKGQPVITANSKGGYKMRVTRAPVAASVDELMNEAVLAHHIALPESNDLHIHLSAGAAVADGERRKVPLKVLIPIDRLKLEREGSEMTGGFTVYLSSGNDHGEATKVNRQSHQIRWPIEAVDKLKGKNVTFNVEVSVAPGVTQISVGVLDNRSEQTGFERLSL